MKKIEAYTMATKKPCKTALKQKGHKAFACDFKGGERANKDTVDYIAEKYNIKERIPGGDRVGQENTEKVQTKQR